MSLPTALDRRRFELFYGSLVLCGSALAIGQLPALLAASGVTDVPPISALLVVGGLGLAVTGGWEAVHRDRAEWEAESRRDGMLVWLVIGFGAMAAGALAYVLLAAR
jgi:hypothetical protein